MTVSRLHAVPFAGDRNFSDVAFVAAIAAGLQAISILRRRCCLRVPCRACCDSSRNMHSFAGPL